VLPVVNTLVGGMVVEVKASLQELEAKVVLRAQLGHDHGLHPSPIIDGVGTHLFNLEKPDFQMITHHDTVSIPLGGACVYHLGKRVFALAVSQTGH
jgi:hypothetical protein